MSRSDSIDLTKQVNETPTKEYCLKTTEYGSHALANISKMKQHDQLCDVTLKVGSKRFNVHKVILASISKYFFAMFNAGMKEEFSSEIVLHDIDSATLELLIDYIYTGQITITLDNVQIILPASDLLQIQEVTEACCHFLIKQLHPTNCLGIRAFAATYSCKDLLAKSHCFVLQNFEQVAATEEFSSLSFDEVEELISNNSLNISSEEIVCDAILNWIKDDLINRRQYIGKVEEVDDNSTLNNTLSEEVVFTAVLNWIKHDLRNRSQYIANLMVHVRLPLLHKDFLMTVVDKEPLMHQDSQCKEFLVETMRYHLVPEYRSAWVAARTVRRKPEGALPYIFAIGGASQCIRQAPCGRSCRYYSQCEVYNPRSDSWHPIAAMRSERCKPGVTGLDGLLYVAGGYDGVSYLATAECYNPLANTWTPITRMKTARCNLGMCSFDGLIYVCGGYNEDSYLRSMDRFDPITGIWQSCPPMSTRRGYCRIAVVENCIYAVGGSGSANYSVERFDPRLGSWSSIPSMSCGHSVSSGCGVGFLNGQIYCIDYSLERSWTRGRFDIRTNAWEQISALCNPRSSPEIVAVDGCLYALNGYYGGFAEYTVEKYDPKINKWFLISSMLVERCFGGAAVLDCDDIEDVLDKTKS